MSLFWLKVGSGIIGIGCACGIPLGIFLNRGASSTLSANLEDSEAEDHCKPSENGEYDGIDYSLVGRNWSQEDRQQVQRALKDHCEGKD